LIEEVPYQHLQSKITVSGGKLEARGHFGAFVFIFAFFRASEISSNNVFQRQGCQIFLGTTDQNGKK
jgi:hypothetical protein